eukprot:15193779-Alexandrium_andersonii.AAC.1
MVKAAARTAALSLGAAEPVALRSGGGAGGVPGKVGVYMPAEKDAQLAMRMAPLPVPGANMEDPTDSEGYQSADGGEARTAHIVLGTLPHEGLRDPRGDAR